MSTTMKKLISIVLSVILAFSAVSCVAETKDEVQEWVMLGNEAAQKEDYETAIHYFQMAADQGDSAAQTNLGVFYINGIGVEQSSEKAAEYFRQAAEQGQAIAQTNLGVMYATGNGVEQSDEKALEYYQMAADQGYAWGQYNLGYCYLVGQGVEVSREKATEYFELAATQGNEMAAQELKAMAAEDKSDGVRSIQDIMDNCYASLMPLTDVYAHSVPTSKDNIEIETQGILIDETNYTVSLTSELNSITFILNDSSKLEAIAGWVFYNLFLYENSDPSQFQIHRKDAAGNVTDVISDIQNYVDAYYDAYDTVPTARITVRNDKWTHLYEGTVNMLITWQMLYTYVSNFGYMDTNSYPEGVLYFDQAGDHYLMISDGSKALVLSLASEQPVLAMGFGALHALHAGFSIDEMRCYVLTADQEDSSKVYAEELTPEMIDGTMAAVQEMISFEEGFLQINDPQSKTESTGE